MIDLERWDEIKEIVQAALDRPEEVRARYLDETCGEDKELRREVNALLAVSETDARFIDDLQVLPPSMRRANLAEGDLAGPYKIIRPLGEGGMGVVYLAQDTRVDRKVALKVGARRLSHEQTFLARLRHDNIATFYDCGTTQDGCGYFAMEHVDGEPIDRYCDRKGLPVRERLQLFLEVCDAVGFAHRKLVVHRDIKPSNILVAEDGKPRLLDFGIAKNIAPDAHSLTLTRPEDRAITLAFASPEQLAGEQTDTATDIYSLGVLLCLLLTGRLPYAVKSYHDLPWAIRNMEPEKPSRLVLKRPERATEGADQVSADAVSPDRTRRLARSLSGDLDAIVLKALRKEPDRRYSTVSELAADIRRHLQSEPVSARRGTRSYRTSRFIRRHRLGVLGTVAAILAFIILSSAAFVQYRVATREKLEASLQANKANRINDFLVTLFRLPDPWKNTEGEVTARQLLDRASERLKDELREEPRLRASMLRTLGTTYSNLSLFKPAEELLRESVRTFESEPSTLVIERVDALNQLGLVLSAQGHFEEARDYYVAAKELLENAEGVNADELGGVLANLGTLYWKMGEYQIAQSHLERSLALLEHSDSPDLESVATCLNSLAVVKNAMGDPDAAVKLHIRALTIRKALYEGDHPTIASSLDNLGAAKRDKGEWSEALSVKREALAMRRRLFGSANVEVARNLSNVGTMLAEGEQWDEAESLFREALAMRQQLLPANHPDIAVTMNNIGALLFKRGDPAGARPILEDALRRKRSSKGDRHSSTANTLQVLGGLLWESGEKEAGEGHFREALEILRAKEKSDSPDLLKAKNLLAFYLILDGRKAEANTLLVEVSGELSSPSTNQILLGENVLYMALLAERSGQLDQCILQAQQAREIWIKIFPKTHSQIALTNAIQGTCLAGKGHYTEAERLLEPAYKILSESRGESSQQARIALHGLEKMYALERR